MSWFPYAMGAAIALACADICVKLAAGKLSNSLGVLLYGGCTFLTGLIWVFIDKARGIEIYAQFPGVLAALGVGFSFSAVTIGLYITFGAGAPISLVSPLVRLGGLLMASLVGLALLQEPLSWRYVLGMVLAISGVYLIISR